MKKIVGFLLLMIPLAAFAASEFKAEKGIFSLSVNSPDIQADNYNDRISGNNSRIEMGGASQFIDFNVANADVARVNGTGLGIGTTNPTGSLDVEGGDVFLASSFTAPADGDLELSQLTFWLDEANNEVEIKAKESGGSIINVTVGSGGGGGGASNAPFANHSLNGPFNTTFERIDGFTSVDATITLTEARLAIGYSGDAGSTGVTIRRAGPSGVGSATATVSANSGVNTSSNVISLSLQAGDYIWVDVTSVATGVSPEDLSVSLYE